MPVLVAGLAGATAVDAGGFHSCAVITGGRVTCWGEKPYGQLGIRTAGEDDYSTSPVPVSGLSGATAVATGWDFTCAIIEGGGSSCWGSDELGQLGDGRYVDSSTPTIVAGLAGAIHVAAGMFHSCAALATGQVTCWGDSDVGKKLGHGVTLDPTGRVLVSGVSQASAVAADGDHSCAVETGGQVTCSGANARVR